MITSFRPAPVKSKRFAVNRKKMITRGNSSHQPLTMKALVPK